MTKKLAILFSIFIAVVITGQGCYTIIKHPRVDYADQSPAHYTRDCYTCHETYTEYPYGHEEVFSPGYWELNENWGRYYAFPWWWEKYWWDVKTDADDEYTPGEDYPDRRRGLTPNPWDRDWGPAGYDPIIPGNGTVTKENTKTKTKTPSEQNKPGKRRGLQPKQSQEKSKTDDNSNKTSAGSKTDK